jgi:hypothetical protein
MSDVQQGEQRRDPYTGERMPSNRLPSDQRTQQQIDEDRTDNYREMPEEKALKADERAAKKAEVVKTKADKKLQEQKDKIILVKDVNKELFDNTTEESDALYPFYQLEVGQGFFVPADNISQDQLMRNFHSQLAYIRQDTAAFERDANGDEVWETVVVKSTTRNADGTTKLQSDGTPIVGSDHVLRPVLINPRRFVVKRISEGYDIGEGKEVEENGVMVIRVA